MKNELPLVTVVIASYHHLAFLEEAVASVREQDYPSDKVELIIMDDASKDGSQDWIRKNQSKYNYTFVLRQKNRGLANNLNSALMMAHGSYFCVLASDDKWRSNKLSMQVAFLEERKDLVGVSGNAVKIDKNGDIYPDKYQRICPNGEWGFAEIMVRKHRLPTVNLVLRTDALKNAGGYNGKFKAEDHYILLRLSSVGGKFALLPEIMGEYRIHGSNTFSKALVMFNDLNAQLAEYKDHHLYTAAVKALRRVYFEQLSREHKMKALSILPDVIGSSKLFYKGVLHLLTPKSIMRYRQQQLVQS
jgi:alpha-1,3-rhamnosyltransferase